MSSYGVARLSDVKRYHIYMSQAYLFRHAMNETQLSRSIFICACYRKVRDILHKIGCAQDLNEFKG